MAGFGVHLGAVRILFITEYGAAQGNPMKASLIEAIQRLRPHWNLRDAHGRLKAYRPGALRPSRLFNLFYIYLGLPLWILRFRPDAILTGSTPPMLQIWAALLGSWCRCKVIVWLLDYHPEMEARWLDARGWSWVARLLRAMDRWALRRTHLVIGLDEAMADAVRRQQPTVAAVAHPTWGTAPVVSVVSSSPPSDSESLRLAYLGNLGAPHDLSLLERLCTIVQEERPVELLAVGCSAAGNTRLERLCAGARCRLFTRPRCTAGELAGHVREFQPHFGIVLLREDYAGLASPSKFMGYLQMGLPLLYIGPRGTNADVACRRFQAGVALVNDASDAELGEGARCVGSAERLDGFRMGAHAAVAHFEGLDEHRFASLLVEAVETAPGRVLAGDRHPRGGGSI